tara:strand:- start:9605 stop:9895 length:291 start_codon:yes stop_codon:yes gene_type:complete
MNIKPANDKVVSISIEGNEIKYTTTNGSGFVNLMDASGEYAAENVSGYVEEVLSLKSDLESCVNSGVINEDMLIDSLMASSKVGFEIGLFSFNTII